MTINRKFFFESVKAELFDGRMSTAQVEGLTRILDEWVSGYASCDDRWLAYILATAHHETGRTMHAVRETFAPNDAAVIRRLEASFGAGKLHWVRTPYWRRDAEGKSWYGRGLVQITHKENYERIGKRIGLDLIKEPDRALDLAVAARIIVLGMIEGLFTRYKLSDYFNAVRDDWRGARRIINGLDRADLIASCEFSGGCSPEAGLGCNRQTPAEDSAG